MSTTLLMLLAILLNGTAQAANPAIDQYLTAIEQQDYATAALSFAYPADLSEEVKQTTLAEVAKTIEEYHKKIGATEQTNIKVARDGSYTNLGLSGGDEIFAMNHPPTNMIRVGAQFKKTGEGFIIFMLATIDGKEEIVFIQYDFKE